MEETLSQQPELPLATKFAEYDRFRYKFIGGYLLLSGSAVVLRSILNGGTYPIILLFPLIDLALGIGALLARPRSLTIIRYVNFLYFFCTVIYLSGSHDPYLEASIRVSAAQSFFIILLTLTSLPRIVSTVSYIALTFIIGYRIYQFL